MDNMPDFDSMTPEEMMAWMEALAKRQGATEGLVTDSDVDVPEIDPDSVDIDEPGYIPFGMDPEVWAQKKAVEDAERAERIAAMKAEKERTAPQAIASPPEQVAEPVAEAAPVDEPQDLLDQTNPLEFLEDMAAAPDVPAFDFDAQNFGTELPPLDELPAAVADDDDDDLEDFGLPDAIGEAGDVPLEDLFADLASAQVPAGDMDWLSSLGQASTDESGIGSLDFGSLEALDEPAPQAAGNPLEWLESLVSGDSDRIEAVADDEDEEQPSEPVAAATAVMDDMLIEDDDDILEDSAVSAVLNDPMEWLADFADTRPMDELANQAAGTGAANDLEAFFDRIQSADAEAAAQPAAEVEEVSDSGLMDFGGTPVFDEDAVAIGSALSHGEEVPAEDMKAWMDSLLDRGIQRTDVTDEDEDEEDISVPEAGELPSWLVEQVGAPPTTEELLANESDLPDWLTAPVTSEQTLEFEEMFNQIQETDAQEEQRISSEMDIAGIEPLDTGAIRVQMDDPWVEAFELERDERMSDTGKLAAWYESAAHEVAAARQAESMAVTPPQPAAASGSSLKSAELPEEEELPAGEPQGIPTWLAAPAEPAADAAPMPPLPAEPAFLETASEGGTDEDLPDWLKSAQIESDEMAEVPTWLTDSLSTDEFNILQIDRQGNPLPIQEEPTTPVPVVPPVQPVPVLSAPPASQRPTTELPRSRAPKELVPMHEAANVINQARASQRIGDVGAMLDSYERLIRSEVALEEVEVDMERVSKDAVHKSNPAVLRVYGDVLLRRGKLQQALDTYRSALNLL